MANNQKKLKAFVRYDGSGRVVAGSLILRKNKPRVGRWFEIPAYECCNYIPSTTTTTTTASISTTTTTSTLIEGICPTLGRAHEFNILAASTITNTGATFITGDLGLYPGTSVTGFPPGEVDGSQNITDVVAQNAQTDALAAFTAFNLLTPTNSVGADIGGETLVAGIYEVSSSLAITGTVTLDGLGDPDAVFIFLIPSTFIPATNAIVSLVDGAQAGNVYWIVGSSATLSTDSFIKGNIIAQTSVTLNTHAELIGRAFALTGAVTLDDNDITLVPCTINPIAGITTTTTTMAPTTTTTTTTV